MDYLHAEDHLNAGDAAVVTLDRQANVLLLDDLNLALPDSSHRVAD